MGILLACWFAGIALFYFSIYPLRLAEFFKGFFNQFDHYAGFNFYYIGDVLFLIITLWFALLIGYLISQLLKVCFSNLFELLIISTGVGLFVLGMVVFFIGIAGYLYGWLMSLFYLAVPPALALVIAGTKLREEFLMHARNANFSPAVKNKNLVALIVALLGFLLIVGFLYTLTPPIQSDGMRYHLAAPQEYIKNHRIIYIPFSAFSNFPFLIEMFFTLGMLLWSDVLSKLYHFAFMILSGLTLALFWKNIIQPELAGLFESKNHMDTQGKEKSPLKAISGEWLVMFIFFATPAIFIVGCWEFIDLGLTFFFLLLIYSLIKWKKTGGAGWLILSGLFGGASLGTKYTMIGFVVAAAAWIVAVELIDRVKDSAVHGLFKRGVPHAILFLAIAGCTGSPWYIKNLAYTGNPVYPFAYSIFNGGEWSEANDAAYKAKAGEKGKPRTIESFFTAPWDTALYWADYEAFNPGLVYLMFYPLTLVLCFILFFRTGAATLLGIKTLIFFAALYFLLWFFSYQSNRFMIPFFALCSLLIVISALKIGYFWRPLRIVAVSMIMVASLYGSLWSLRWILTEAHPHPLPVVLGFENRDTYLQKALNYYPCAQWLNLKAGSGEKVFFVGEHRGYHFSRITYLTSDWFDTPYLIYLIRSTGSNEEIFEWLERNNVVYVFINMAELEAYFHSYFKPRFTPYEIDRFMAFISSDRLVQVFPPGVDKTYVCRIK